MRTLVEGAKSYAAMQDGATTDEVPSMEVPIELKTVLRIAGTFQPTRWVHCLASH